MNNMNKTCVRSKDNMNGVGDMPMLAKMKKQFRDFINFVKKETYGYSDFKDWTCKVDTKHKWPCIDWKAYSIIKSESNEKAEFTQDQIDEIKLGLEQLDKGQGTAFKDFLKKVS